MKGWYNMLPSRMFFNNLFDNMKEYDNVLKCDVLDNDDNYIFEFDVFGFNKDDINIIKGLGKLLR